MNALEYLTERNRMCKRMGKFCINCPLSWTETKDPESGRRVRFSMIAPDSDRTCASMEEMMPELAYKIVKEWSEENPVQTWLREFHKRFPDTQMEDRAIQSNLCVSTLFGAKAICIAMETTVGCEPCDGKCECCWMMEYKFKEK